MRRNEALRGLALGPKIMAHRRSQSAGQKRAAIMYTLIQDRKAQRDPSAGFLLADTLSKIAEIAADLGLANSYLGTCPTAARAPPKRNRGPSAEG